MLRQHDKRYSAQFDRNFVDGLNMVILWSIQAVRCVYDMIPYSLLVLYGRTITLTLST